MIKVLGRFSNGVLALGGRCQMSTACIIVTHVVRAAVRHRFGSGALTPFHPELGGNNADGRVQNPALVIRGRVIARWMPLAGLACFLAPVQWLCRSVMPHVVSFTLHRLSFIVSPAYANKANRRDVSCFRVLHFLQDGVRLCRNKSC